MLVDPGQSQLPEFCSGAGRYVVGEKVSLEALPHGRSAFYEWKGGLEYLAGSEEHKSAISIVLLEDATATARFLEAGAYPPMRTFPTDGRHNTGWDRTCSPAPCKLACGPEAKALANDDCHFGGVDIFAELGTPIVTAERGEVSFRCDFDRDKQELVGGNVAEVYFPNAKTPQFILYYAHLDGVCSVKGTNLCTREWLDQNGCPGCLEHVPETTTVCRKLYRDGDRISHGQRLGTAGRSGNAVGTSHHLHFGVFDSEWRASCEVMNPFPFLYPLEERTSCRSPR